MSGRLVGRAEGGQWIDVRTVKQDLVGSGMVVVRADRHYELLIMNNQPDVVECVLVIGPGSVLPGFLFALVQMLSKANHDTLIARTAIKAQT